MLCNKCGTELPDDARFCPVCGRKLQSGRLVGGGGDGMGETDDPSASARMNASTDAEGEPRLLEFQGWTEPKRGIGPYVEACVYAMILAGGVTWCLLIGILWPLYPLLGILGLTAWLRRL